MRTKTLMNRIFSAPSLRTLLDENGRAMSLPSFVERMDALCRQRGATRESVIVASGIERTFGHQLLRGARRASRDNVLRFAFGLGLDVDGAQALLKSARKAPLCPQVRRDVVVLYALSHKMSVRDAQASLYELGLPLLGGEKYERSER